jgi:drug/metabolite transporter (DMT)-like permease
MVLMAIGLMVIPTGRSVVLAYTTPLWVTPAAALLLRESLTPRRVIGVVVGLIGLVALFNPLTFDWSERGVVWGNLAILAAALLWAASIVHIRAHRWISTPFVLIPWETLLATLLLTPIALATTCDGIPVPVSATLTTTRCRRPHLAARSRSVGSALMRLKPTRVATKIHTQPSM